MTAVFLFLAADPDGADPDEFVGGFTHTGITLSQHILFHPSSRDLLQGSDSAVRHERRARTAKMATAVRTRKRSAPEP